MISGGSGYAVAPTVNFVGGGGYGATGTASITGIVNSIAVTNGGTGYSPGTTTVSITGGGGSGATASAIIVGDAVVGITITNPGSGYTSAPSVNILGGSGATATATFTRIVTGVTITNGGVGYTSTPTVTFSGGGGSGALATASPNSLPGRVFKSEDAGQNWTDISGALPDVPTWKIDIDPRTNDLYLGNDLGVYRLLDNPTGNDPTGWARLGIGLPNVAVHDLDLNLTFNTISAGTYGRSMFRFYLDDVKPDAGVFRALSGSNTWTGPIILAGDSIIGVSGVPTANAVVPAQLTLSGVISDQIDNADYLVTKKGFGELILSGANTYGGITDITEGVVVARNRKALGNSDTETIVRTGTALELEGDLEQEPLYLFGNGINQDGHHTGALRNVSGSNTYTGTIKLMSNDATIGVDANSTLTIGTSTLLAGSGSITKDSSVSTANLTKELTGTLVFNTANFHDGLTSVNQGILRVMHSDALGSSTLPTQLGTRVLDGATLELQTPTGGTLEVNEELNLSGTGDNGTGALRNTGGNNSWKGEIVLRALPGFLDDTAPGAEVAIGVKNEVDTLTIDGVVRETTTIGLRKVGPGTLVLTNANTYSGITNIISGVVNIQNAAGLGSSGNGVTAVTIANGGTGYHSATTTVLFSGGGGGGTGATGTAVVDGFGVITGVIITNPGTGYTSAPTVTFTDSDVSPGSGATASTAIGTLEVQRVTMYSPNSTGSFSLNFNGQTTPALPWAASLPPTDAQVEAQLNLLSTISNGGTGSVSVTREDIVINTPGGPRNTYVYVVTFKGSLAGINQNQLVATGINGTTAVAGTAAQGAVGTLVTSGAALELQGNITVGGEVLELNGTGIAPNNLGGLRNRSGSNVWSGLITLPTNSSIGVDAGSDLTVSGTIQDPNPDLTPPPTAPATLTKVGTGTLVLPSANTYIGETFINAGIVNIRHGQALGLTTSEIQRVTVSGGANVLTDTFRLTFNDGVTSHQTGNLAFNVPATGGVGPTASMQNALEALPNIGVGNVTVSQVGQFYTITFIGTLAGIPLNQITDLESGSVITSVTTLQDGGNGNTTVAADAALQIQGGITVNKERLTLNGDGPPAGVGGNGVLENVSGTNTWNGLITLTSNVTIGVNVASDRLVLAQAISQSAPPLTNFGVTKIGPGTLHYQGSNTYGGMTFVNDGELWLENITSNSLSGSLTIGSAAGLGASVQWRANNQVLDQASVFVLGDGLMDLNDRTETFTSLSITDGEATTGTTGGGALTLIGASALTMSGGQLTINGVVNLGNAAGTGNLTAASSATETAIIATTSGTGILALGNTTRAFTVNNGPTAADIDLKVFASITGSSAAGISKTGAGAMEIHNASNPYPGSTNIQQGDVYVMSPGVIGAVSLNGATARLGGNGTVGAVTSTAAGGTITPGSFGPAILKTGAVTVSAVSGANTSYYVELNGTTVGTGYDRLQITGNLNLNGATLSGIAVPGFLDTDSFTIITTTGTITGTFANAPLKVTLGSERFAVVYNAQSVVLKPIVYTPSVNPNPATTAEDTQTSGVGKVNMTSVGSGYTAATISFTGGGGTGATGTAIIAGGQITGVTITNPGTGYTSAPTVGIVGDGTGAAGSAVTGLVIARNPADGGEVTHYKITSITNGRLFQSDGTTEILAGTFISEAQGAAGLKFTPTANYSGAASFQVQGSSSNVDAGLGGLPVAVNINVTAVNDAPVLAAASHALTPITINEPDVSNPGNTVAEIVANGSITDVDYPPPAVEAIAVTAVGGNGTWEYSLNGGTTWNTLVVTSGNALRLDFDNKIRFRPDLNFIGTSTITFRAWDKTDLLVAGNNSSLGATGNATAYSGGTQGSASISVTNPGNDAPLLAASFSPTLTSIAVNNTNPAGNTVAEIVVDGSITDVDGAPVEAIAITSVDNTLGTWQYFNGSSWTPIVGVSFSNALLLDSTKLIRFLPTATGTATFRFHAWDMSSGAAFGFADLTGNTGGITPFSGNINGETPDGSDTASITITAAPNPPIIVVAGTPQTLLDEDGETIQIVLKGPGQAVVTQNSDGSQPGWGSINSIVLSGTTAKSTLLVGIRKFSTDTEVDLKVSIGSITGTGLKSITAKESDLNGAGINLGGNALGKLVLASVINGADIVAGSIDSIAISGNFGNGTGNSDLTLTGNPNPTKRTLGKAAIKGSILNATNGIWDINGNVGTLAVAGSVGSEVGPARWTVDIHGTLKGAKFLQQVNDATISVDFNVTSFSAGTFKDSNLFVGMTDTDSDPRNGGTTFTSGVLLKTFKVTGVSSAFSNSTVAATRISKATLTSIAPNNSDVEFGILWHDPTLIPTVKVTTPTFVFSATQQSPNFIDDFYVRLI